MKRHFSQNILLVLILIAAALPSLALTDQVTKESNHITESNGLTQPWFVPLFDQQVFQTDINLVINNGNEGSSTEIYRSTAENGTYTLIHTQPPGAREFKYVDQDVKPRTTFYYKARAIMEGETSEYSAVFSATSQSKFYAPYFEASYEHDYSVTITFQDRSYHDSFYNIYRVDEDGTNTLIIEEQLTLSDSGQTRIYHDLPDPDRRYIYHVDAEVRDEGFPMYYSVATDTIDGVYPPLTVPEFTPPGEYPCGNAIAFGVNNETTGAFTEIFMSLDRNGEYQHYGTLSPGETGFSDSNLKSRTTYYFTMRSEMDGRFSEFSDTLGLTTGSEFFNPVLNAELMDSGEVKISLTDRSYGDGYYEIFKTYTNHTGESVSEMIGELILSDSGATGVLYDTAIHQTGKTIYKANVYLACEGQEKLNDVAMDEVNKGVPNTLAPPTFDFVSQPTEFPCGNEIAFNFDNPNSQSSTEIYRSIHRDSGFELVFTSGADVTFIDRGLISSGTYFYKLRAVSDEGASEFSETRQFTADAEYILPVLSYEYIKEDDQINITFESRSALPFAYELYSVEQSTGNVPFNENFALDSGASTIFEQYNVTPGETYIFYVNTTLKCEGSPYLTNIIVDTVRIDDGPAVYNFVLVDPYTDEDVRDMWPLDEGFSAQDRYNIRVEANDLTESVLFVLNGTDGERSYKEYRWGENQEPYAVFGDRNGDFNLGRLKPGDYTLTATAYSENLRKGTQGNTIGTNFTVYDDGSVSLMTADDSQIQMNVFPNPVISRADIEISGTPNEAVLIEVVDATGNVVRSKQDIIDQDGYLFRQWQVDDLKKGTYFIAIKMNDKSLTRRVLIK